MGLALLGAALALFALVRPAVAGAVSATTSVESYPMEGSTPATILDYFHRYPLPGDRGPALAHISYTSHLALNIRQSGRGCSVASARVNMDFVITLPVATQFAAMSRSTRAMWNQLAGFARAHEYGHRARDLRCARNFVARVARLSGESCGRVESAARAMLAVSETDCAAGQVAYDRSEAVRAGNLALFKAARLARP